MRWMLALAAALLAIGAAVIWLSFAPAGPPSGAPLTTGVTAADTHSAAPAGKPSATAPEAAVVEQRTPAASMPPAPASSQAVASVPLPAAGIPLRDSIDSLIAQSRAGNPAASRRLFEELTDCLGFRVANRQVDLALAVEESGRDGPRGGEFLRQMMNRAAETVAKLDEQCRDLPADYDSALLFEVQRRVAELGDLAGQLAFVVAPAMDLSRAIEQRDRVAAFTELAPRFALAALEQASGQAVFALMNGYDSQPEWWRSRRGPGPNGGNAVARAMMMSSAPRSALQQALGADDTKAYQFALLCKKVCNGADVDVASTTIARLESGLSSEQRDLARRDADTLFDRHFAGKPRPDDIDLSELRMAQSGFVIRGR